MRYSNITRFDPFIYMPLYVFIIPLKSFTTKSSLLPYKVSKPRLVKRVYAVKGEGQHTGE